MTEPRPLTMRWTTPDARTLHGALAGNLDYHSGDGLLSEVTARLAPGLRDVRLDFGSLDFCDSYGLSTLLMIARRVQSAGANLHLDDRPPVLERLLDMTRTLDYLTAPARKTSQGEAD
ncbi:STAS domain-containing protein [Amycolatopsis sp. ATCC 39116]|uniref:STAS domain-containing protein n=1 Tax=Amycolatopsis sp. (strain ATCC 39116 / 75iv2) TaxID=385957 RepID=UPI0002627971|nr:STAS domain-containing protein [Amycolatopsis sp. ATCC 39116]